jgi:hypothetical protein
LTFYHFSNEDLEELKKLIALINTDNIRLYIPEQTQNEFNRNREVKIADSLDKLRGTKLGNQFPMICHSYDEYDLMKIPQINSDSAKTIKTYLHLVKNGVYDSISQLLTQLPTDVCNLLQSGIRFDEIEYSIRHNNS